MISLENLTETTTTNIDAKGKGRQLVVCFEKTEGFGFMSQAYESLEAARHAIAFAGQANWKPVSASWVTYREPTTAEVTGNGRWGCE